MVMSMSLIVNRTHRHTHAQPRSRIVVAFQSERRRLRRGEHTVLEERAADRGWL